MSTRTIILMAGLTCAAFGSLEAPRAHAGIEIGASVTVAPPALPVYAQPPIPAPGYLWVPGYWAWDGADFYWVPGTWVMPPAAGYLWTPGYWGWFNGAYVWHAGYWGPHVGFYGGINYGCGYPGTGFYGGEWRGGAFFYNRNVANIPPSVHITNVYNRTVINNISVNRVSYNGGVGGIETRPTPAQLAAEHEHHLAPLAAQLRQQQIARANPALRASVNHGAPAIAATQRPGRFGGAGVVGARNAAPSASRSAGMHAVSSPHAPSPHAPSVNASVHEPSEHALTREPPVRAPRPARPVVSAPAAHLATAAAHGPMPTGGAREMHEDARPPAHEAGPHGGTPEHAGHGERGRER